MCGSKYVHEEMEKLISRSQGWGQSKLTWPYTYPDHARGISLVIPTRTVAVAPSVLLIGIG